MIINRDDYIKELLDKRRNGKVKIIIGIRRCGKSFLLSKKYCVSSTSPVRALDFSRG